MTIVEVTPTLAWRQTWFRLHIWFPGCCLFLCILLVMCKSARWGESVWLWYVHVP
jgi:hypothetical protein